jgi:hypothetical protein
MSYLPIIQSKMRNQRRKNQGNVVATNAKRMPPLQYIALNCPEECLEIIKEYDVKPTSLDDVKGIAERLNFIAKQHEDAQKKIADIHPDKELILKYCGKPASAEGDAVVVDEKTPVKTEDKPATIDYMTKLKPIGQGILIGGGVVLGIVIMVKLFTPVRVS